MGSIWPSIGGVAAAFLAKEKRGCAYLVFRPAFPAEIEAAEAKGAG